MNDFDEKKVNEEMLDAETSVEEELKEASAETSVEEELEEASAEDFSEERSSGTVKESQRIYPADRKRLVELTEKHQNEGGRAYVVHKMLDLYELNELPGRAEEDERVKAALDFAWKAYKNSVAMYKRIDTDLRYELSERYNTNLQEKDKTIGELKEQNAMLKTAKEDAEKCLHDVTQKAESFANDLENARNRAEKKEQFSEQLALQLTDAREKLKGYDALRESAEELKKKIADMQHQHAEDENMLKHTKELYETRLSREKETEKRCAKLEEDCEHLKEKLADTERMLADTKKDMEKAQIQADLDREHAVMDKEREMDKKLREAIEENIRLNVRLEQVQPKSTDTDETEKGTQSNN